MLIDWLNSWDRSKSIDWNQAQLVNWYLVANKRGKLPLAAFPTPGTLSFTNLGGSSCRGGWSYNGVLYVVVDNQFCSVASNGTKTVLGTLNTSTGHLGVNHFAATSFQIMLVDGTDGYIYDLTEEEFSVIDDVDFPSDTQCVTAQDGYFLVNRPGTGFVVFSSISDGLEWNALNTFQKNRVASNVTGVVAVHGLINVIGADSIEPYFNSGAPFERQQDTLLYIGTEYLDTYCIASDASSYFLAAQDGGGVMVVQAKADQFISISEAIDYDLSQLTVVSDAFAYIYKQEGNEFYQITFPTEGKTFVYHFNTESWHARQSYKNSTYTRHLANFITYAYGKIIIGDYNTGNLYYLSTSYYTENGTPIRRQLTTYPFFNESLYITLSRLIVEFETNVGDDTDIDIQFSKDSGHTYTSFTPTRSIGASGTRLVYNALGSARQWSFKVETTMTDKCIMLGAVGTVRSGAN